MSGEPGTRSGSEEPGGCTGSADVEGADVEAGETGEEAVVELLDPASRVYHEGVKAFNTSANMYDVNLHIIHGCLDFLF